MDFRKMIDEMIFNEKLHQQKGILPPNHPVTGNIDIVYLWYTMDKIDEIYQIQNE